ncbi:hypothetical protein [Microcoleus sp. FACHB-68]|uniref:hypothetical protein n=1 Tax=Microcoleus sp. FACHB-68 TaxID=2692826 RepID=UPI0016886C45|nr:hypothetical protein [Microcoleus sp. FACHB-68]
MVTREKGHRAWGMGHWAWGMGHRSRLRQPKGRGIGDGALGMGHRSQHSALSLSGCAGRR